MSETDDDERDGIRLQKVLAQAGIASRRASEQLIQAGRVEVNGELVTEQGRRVDPEKDEIRVDGSRIPTARRHVYTVLNKPRGVVSTMDDPEGRETLTDYIDRRNVRLFHVGRLDTETEGLIILTNDGEFAHRLAHPSYEVPKTYVAQVLGQVSPHTLKRIQRGITLEDGPVRPDKVKVMQTMPDATLLQITLHEGRNRVVRRMMEAFGHPVQKLTRIAIGPVRLGRLQPGEMRDLTQEELGKLLDLVGM
ncbi:pseudouridine synthase [Raineyella fluvialis]|uniref:Pseudouridine synthase n=1 Tax=Raineyella fluvialis TaxID=2662261 RepID=A0A5Q2FCN3_9ACTN|nr:pseudouridine synthase [Raineyella fluvialis]QGF24850.1 pseudouridine synthase [Raineyella fluvialis]